MLVEHGTLLGELEQGRADLIAANPSVDKDADEAALDHAAMEFGTD